jgi:hypothetical protein
MWSKQRRSLCQPKARRHHFQLLQGEYCLSSYGTPHFMRSATWFFGFANPGYGRCHVAPFVNRSRDAAISSSFESIACRPTAPRISCGAQHGSLALRIIVYIAFRDFTRTSSFSIQVSNIFSLSDFLMLARLSRTSVGVNSLPLDDQWSSMGDSSDMIGETSGTSRDDCFRVGTSSVLCVDSPTRERCF